ncbi:MAG: hypothetical protein IJH65_08550 [Methanobrevibacter sp.]|nr:hypothetical protein [Methanobrevibacter sp.]
MKENLKDICWAVATMPILLLGFVIAVIYAGVHWIGDSFMKLMEKI